MFVDFGLYGETGPLKRSNFVINLLQLILHGPYLIRDNVYLVMGTVGVPYALKRGDAHPRTKGFYMQPIHVAHERQDCYVALCASCAASSACATQRSTFDALDFVAVALHWPLMLASMSMTAAAVPQCSVLSPTAAV